MKSSDLLCEIANPDNLMLAWRKVEGEMSRLDDWCDIMEFHAYKFNLKDNLDDLHQRLVEGRYEMQPIRPLPFPKGSDSKGKKRVRQFFHVAIEDQLVWIAYCNVIAQFVERIMPGWSFGNRTDIRVWYQNHGLGKERKLHVGNYRNTSGYIYKKWNYSWPRYRKLLSLTIKLMSKSKGGNSPTPDGPPFEEYELQLLKDNANAAEQHLDYLDNGYFDKIDNGDKLYWAGLDIEKFYPNVNRQLIKDNLLQIIFTTRQSEGFLALTNKLLDFKIDITGFKAEDLDAMELSHDGSYPIGIPTGLLVGGFLANLAMIAIDTEVRRLLYSNHKVAHFRYVDDHVVLAQDRDSLLVWITQYIDLLEKSGFKINKEKIEPREIADYFAKEDKNKDKPELKGLDPKYPTPLMTLTLQKVSQLADMNMEQLTKTEFDIVFSDLQELLILDIDEQEIKKETRLSFAVTMLTRILAHGDVDYEELGRTKQKLRKKLERRKLMSDDKISEIWKEWFYRDDLYDLTFLNDKKFPKEELDVIKAKASKANGIYKNAQENDERKFLYIFNLIEKTLEDVPERSRIWIRMVHFCYMHLPKHLGRVLNMLNYSAILEKLHQLDLLYIRMMLINKMASLMMRDVRSKSCGEGYMEARKILQKEVENYYQQNSVDYYYVQETILYLQHVLMLHNYLNEGKGILDNMQLYTGQWIDSDFWILYYLQFVKDEYPEDKEHYINAFLPLINKQSPYYAPLFLKCMSSKVFQESELADAAMDEEIVKYIKRHHLELDVYRSIRTEYRETIAGLIGMEEAEKAPDGYMTLSEWITELSLLNRDGDHALAFSHHLEYIALKVVRAAVESVDKLQNNILDLKALASIHLFNVCIKKECIENITKVAYWEKDNDIIRIFENKSVPSGRHPLDPFFLHNEYKDVYDFGVIMLQMLVLEHLPSDYLLDPEYGYKWERVVNQLMRSGFISFYTYMILMACLSNRSRETIQIKHNQENARNDESLDPPVIFSLKQLQNHLDLDIKLFEKNMNTVPGGGTRTLSVVSLETFNNFYEKVKQEQTAEIQLEEYLKVDVIQTNLDHRQAWSGLASKGYKMTASEMKKCWSEIVMFFKQIMELDDYARPQLVILPEFAFDHEYYWQLKHLSDKTGCLVIAGRNFVELPGKWLMNKAVVFVPMKWPMGKGSTSLKSFEFGKYFFAREEEKFIKGIGFKPLKDDKMYLVEMGKYGKMGLAICADFYDIERFAIYRGRIQHLVIIAYNKDIKSFYYLAEAISRIVYCNVVICNTGFYGGSIAFSPYKEEYKRYVYKHEGGNLYTNQIVSIPVKGLYEAQHTGNEDFKSKPPGYEAID